MRTSEILTLSLMVTVAKARRFPAPLMGLIESTLIMGFLFSSFKVSNCESRPVIVVKGFLTFHSAAGRHPAAFLHLIRPRRSHRTPITNAIHVRPKFCHVPCNESRPELFLSGEAAFADPSKQC